MLKGKKILLAVTGSIAAYKIPLLVRLLVKDGAEVKVIMTPAATDFVSRLTLSTLSNNPVNSDLFEDGTWANHVMLGRWADLMIIAPLSCNTLAKMAGGLCDNLVLATYLSATCPVALAPAMDEDMWHHASTKRNLDLVAKAGARIIPVVYGSLASGLVGEGRMAEPEDIMKQVQSWLGNSESLKGKKLLITAGPTYEALDPVRFIGNHSSGKMGYALAAECRARGAEVTLVSGPVSIEQIPGINLVKVTSAEEMYEVCQQYLDYDIAIMAAAVADYTPAEVAEQKIKKGTEDLVLTFKRTKDILASLGKQKKKGQVLVGFALETQHERNNALKKLEEKNADLIVLNSLNDAGAGFGHDTNKVTLFYKKGKEQSIDLESKTGLAIKIIDALTEIDS